MTSSVEPESKPVERVRSRQALAEIVDSWRRDGYRIGVVPTMGALHAGHLSLLSHIKNHCDKIITTIFVNPAQFGPDEDLDSYPREEESDIAKLAAEGCDVVYLPRVEEMYPPGSLTHVRVEELSDLLEGQFRPQFFYGVTTVVSRLFIHTRPDVAIFGEKDYQQLQIIRRMVVDLGFPIRIIGAPTLRAESGLALSSRNAYLSEQELANAASVFRELSKVKIGVEAGGDIVDLLKHAEVELLSNGFKSVDYISLVDTLTFQPIVSLENTDDVRAVSVDNSNSMSSNENNQEARLLVAAWMGTTRLIDNMSVTLP